MTQNPTESPPTSADEQPDRRFRWLKRLSILGAAGGLLMAAAWVGWDQYSRYEVNRRLTAYAHAGEPAASKEYQPKSVPESENAAPWYIKAAGAVSTVAISPSMSSEVFDGRLPYEKEWMDMARQAMETNGEAIQLSRKASSYPKVDWGIQLASPPMSTALPALASQRNLANLMGDVSVYEHLTGDDANAFADARNLLHEGRALEQTPLLMPWLVGIGIDALALDRLEVIAVGMTIKSGTTGDARGVSRADVYGLIAELLDDGPFRQRICSIIKWDRVLIAEDAATLVSQGWAIQPAARLDTAALMDGNTACAEAVLLQTFHFREGESSGAVTLAQGGIGCRRPVRGPRDRCAARWVRDGPWRS